MAEIDKFWQEVLNLLEPVTEKKVSYRLYYNDDGTCLFYSMDDLVGNYIEVSQEVFALSDPNVKVQNGKLVKINPNKSFKLIPAETGIKTSLLDIAIVVDNEPFAQWNITNYESDN